MTPCVVVDLQSSCWWLWGCAKIAVLESVAVSFQGDDFGVVDEPVDYCGGDDVVAADLAPAAEGLLLVTMWLARS